MSKKAKTKVSLQTEELKDFLKHIITNNRHLQTKGKIPAAVEVVGESGIGKTSTILQVAEEMNLDCVKINLSQIEEIGDLTGYPVRQFQVCKAIPSSAKVPVEKIVEKTVIENRPTMRTVMVEGKEVQREVMIPTEVKIQEKVVEEITEDITECLWIDEQATDEYIKRGYQFTGEKRMSYCPPEWIAGKEKGGILLLDDWNRADYK